MPETPAQREVREAATRGTLRAILIVVAIALAIAVMVFIAHAAITPGPAYHGG